MIVTRRPEGLSLVTQVEHGRIAGELASQWGNADFAPPSPRDPVVLAATRHDEGWRTRDARPLFNEVQRRPLHFLEIDPDDHVRLYREGVERVRLGDAYAGLLVGMHWTGLYRGRWSVPGARGRLARGDHDEALLDEVVHAEEVRWVQARAEAWTQAEPRARFETTLWHHYELLQLWDLLSLFLCVMPQEADPDTEPRPWGPQLSSLTHVATPVTLPPVRRSPFDAAPVTITVRVAGRGRAELTPWPFAGDSFQVDVEHSPVPDRAYARPEDAAIAVARARTDTIRWELRRAPSAERAAHER